MKHNAEREGSVGAKGDSADAVFSNTVVENSMDNPHDAAHPFVFSSQTIGGENVVVQGEEVVQIPLSEIGMGARKDNSIHKTETIIDADIIEPAVVQSADRGEVVPDTRAIPRDTKITYIPVAPETQPVANPALSGRYHFSLRKKSPAQTNEPRKEAQKPFETAVESPTNTDESWKEILDFEKRVDKKIPTYATTTPENIPPAPSEIVRKSGDTQYLEKAYNHYKRHERIFEKDPVTGKIIEPIVKEPISESELEGKTSKQKRELRYARAYSFFERMDWLRTQIEDAIAEKNKNKALIAMKELQENDYLNRGNEAYDEADKLYAEDTEAELKKMHDTAFELERRTSQAQQEAPVDVFSVPRSQRRDEQTRPLKGSGIPQPSEAMKQYAAEVNAPKEVRKSILSRATSWAKGLFSRKK